MPIYAFQCADCGHSFDRLQKMSDPDPASCPECGASAVTRQLTAPSFRLAGSGWYETDFKKDGDKKRNLVESSDGGAKSGADTPAPDATAAKTESRAESKPAATESKPAVKPAAKPASAD